MTPLSGAGKQIGDRVYLNWKFIDGKVWSRLTPYKEIPWVEMEPLTEYV